MILCSSTTFLRTKKLYVVLTNDLHDFGVLTGLFSCKIAYQGCKGMVPSAVATSAYTLW